MGAYGVIGFGSYSYMMWCSLATGAICATVTALLLWARGSKARREAHVQLYEQGKALLEKGDPLWALALLSEAVGCDRSQAAYNKLAISLERLKRPDLAAEACRQARRAAMDSGHDVKHVAYFYYREAYAFADASNWGFAFIRTTDGIQTIRRNEIPRMVEGVDYETELRVLRMLAALRHLHGSEAFRVASEDAHWIIANSDNPKHKELATTFTQMPSTHLAMQLALFDDMRPFEMN